MAHCVRGRWLLTTIVLDGLVHIVNVGVDHAISHAIKLEREYPSAVNKTAMVVLTWTLNSGQRTVKRV